jgi:hypothetical protein
MKKTDSGFKPIIILGSLAGFAWIGGIILLARYSASLGGGLLFISVFVAAFVAYLSFKGNAGCMAALALFFPPIMILFGFFFLLAAIMGLPQSRRNILFFLGLAAVPVWSILLVLHISQNFYTFSILVVILFGLGVIPIVLLLFGISFLRKTSQRAILLSIIPVGLVLCLGSYGIAILENDRRCHNLQPGAHLEACSFANQSLTRLQLEGASFNQANLSGANLTGANLANASLADANLRSADLTQANLAGAAMPGADLSGAAGLTSEMLGSLGDWHGLMLEPIENLISPLGGVCLGKPIPTAAAYDASPDRFHPLYLMDGDGTSSGWTKAIPRRWWPSQLKLAELVACAGKEVEYHADSCTYENGSTITRSGYHVEIQLMAAQTGKIAQTVWADGQIDSCPNQTTGGGSIKGSSVYAADILKALQTYVNPAGRMDPLTIP